MCPNSVIPFVVVIVIVCISSVIASTMESTRLTGKLTGGLPPPMTSTEPGTWAFDTMSRRVSKEIIPRIINDNEAELTRPTSPHRSECLLVLNDLISSLDSGSTGFLRGLADQGPDVKLWDQILRDIPEDQGWLQRHRAEAVGGNAAGVAAGIATGDHGDAGGESTEAVPEGQGIGH